MFLQPQGAFSYNIPQRWSIAHLYQAILNGEEHVKEIAYFTTLAGYVTADLADQAKDDYAWELIRSLI